MRLVCKHVKLLINEMSFQNMFKKELISWTLSKFISLTWLWSKNGVRKFSGCVCGPISGKHRSSSSSSFNRKVEYIIVIDVIYDDYDSTV